MGAGKFVDALASVAGEGDVEAVLSEIKFHDFADHGVVFGEEDTLSCSDDWGLGGRRKDGRGRGRLGSREGDWNEDGDFAAASLFGFDFEFAAVALEDPVDDAEAGGTPVGVARAEVGIEAAFAGKFAHAQSVVADGEDDEVFALGGDEGDGASAGDGVDGVEEKEGDEFAELGCFAVDFGDGLEAFTDVDHDAAGLGFMLPFGLGKGDGLLDDVGEDELPVGVCLGAGKLPDAPDGGGSDVGCGLDFLDDVLGGVVVGEVFGFTKEVLGPADDGGEDVVEFVGDAVGHRAECGETFAVDEFLLGGAEGGESLSELFVAGGGGFLGAFALGDFDLKALVSVYEFGGAFVDAGFELVVGLAEGDLGAFTLDGVLEGAEEEVVVHLAFDEVILRTGLDELDGSGNIGDPADDDDCDVRGDGVDGAEGVAGETVGKGEIEEDGVDAAKAQRSQSLCEITRNSRVKSWVRSSAEDVLKEPRVLRSILHDQYFDGLACHGWRAISPCEALN